MKYSERVPSKISSKFYKCGISETIFYVRGLRGVLVLHFSLGFDFSLIKYRGYSSGDPDERIPLMEGQDSKT